MEEEGIPTACISVIRPYTEKVKPPRSLWVPFELGRPLGVPDDAAFQKRVLLALLKLLEAPENQDRVLIEDYLEEAPEVIDDMTGLSCPVDYGNYDKEGDDSLETAFLREMRAMRTWYDVGVAKRKRTTVGVSGIDLDSIGNFIYAFIKGIKPENPRKDVELATVLKAAVEDLRAYYFEGVTSQPGRENASNKALLDWFWGETVAGGVLLKLVKVCENNQDESLKMLASRFLVPSSWTYQVRRKEK